MKFHYSNSLGLPYKERIKKYWGLKEWRGNIIEPVLFVGLYDWRDYLALMKHCNKKYIYWCGGDILRLNKLKSWIITRFAEAEHFCDNEVEQRELAKWNIEAKVKPAFFEDVNKYPLSFEPSDKIHIYSVVRKGELDKYGFWEIVKMVKKFPSYVFHIYGLKYFPDPPYINMLPYKNNIILHGTVPEEQFNEEIKNYHCALRPNKWDGFSDVVAKSVLMGQWPITRIKYQYITHYNTEDKLEFFLNELKFREMPNIIGREYWQKNFNQFPFL